MYRYGQPHPLSYARMGQIPGLLSRLPGRAPMALDRPRALPPIPPQQPALPPVTVTRAQAWEQIQNAITQNADPAYMTTLFERFNRASRADPILRQQWDDQAGGPPQRVWIWYGGANRAQVVQGFSYSERSWFEVIGTFDSPQRALEPIAFALGAHASPERFFAIGAENDIPMGIWYGQSSL